MKCLHGRTRSSDGLTDWIGLFNRFRRDQSGATLVFSALAMALVLGMAGLGFDATFWFMTKRQIQTVADVSVISGVTVMTKGGGSAEVRDSDGDMVEASDHWGLRDFRPSYSAPMAAAKRRCGAALTGH